VTDQRDTSLERVISEMGLTLARIETQSTASEKVLNQLASDLKDVQKGMGDYVKRADLDDLKNELGGRWKLVASSSDIKSIEKDLLRFESQIDKDRMKMASEYNALRAGELREVRDQLEQIKTFYNKVLGALAIMVFVIPLIVKYLI